MPALVGLLGPVSVAASPERPGVAVRLVAVGLGDDGPARLAQQFGHGDRDQPQGCGSAAVTGTLPRGGDGRKAQTSRLIAVQRCQEVQVVTWPLSSPAACLDSW